MVLAQTVELDVLHDDHAVGFLREDSAIDELHRIRPVARCQECDGVGDPARRALEALAIGILADGQYQFASERFDLPGINVHGVSPRRWNRKTGSMREFARADLR